MKYRDKANLFLPFRGSTINKHEAQRGVSVMQRTPWCIPHGALASISFKMPQKELIHLKRVSNRGEAKHFDLTQNWLGCRFRQTGEQNIPAEVTLSKSLLQQDRKKQKAYLNSSLTDGSLKRFCAHAGKTIFRVSGNYAYTGVLFIASLRAFRLL